MKTQPFNPSTLQPFNPSGRKLGSYILAIFFISLYFNTIHAQSIDFNSYTIYSGQSCVFKIVEDSIDVLVLNDTIGGCISEINIAKNASTFTNTLLRTTGLLSSDTGKVIISLFQGSSLVNALEIFGSLDGSEFNLDFGTANILAIRGDDDEQVELTTPYPTEIQLTSLHEEIDFGLLMDVVFYSSSGGNNTQIKLRFLEPVQYIFGTDTLESTSISVRTNTSWNNFDTITINILNVDHPIGIDEIFTNMTPLSVNTLPTDMQAGREVILTGQRFDLLYNLLIEDNSVNFEILHQDTLLVFLPSNLPDTVDITFISPVNKVLIPGIPIKHFWRGAMLVGPPSILYEDSTVQVYVNWIEEEENALYHLALFKGEVSDTFSFLPEQDTFLSTSEFIFYNLDKDSAYFIVLLQYDDFYTDYIPAGILEFVASNNGGEQITISEQLMNALDGWSEVHDTITYVEFLQSSDLHDIVIRSYLQAINGGQGFDDSEYPWYSPIGPIYSRGPNIGPPGDPEDPGDEDPNAPDCLCQFVIHTSHLPHEHINYLRPGSNEFHYGWYNPIVNKWVDKDKSGYRVWLRTQKAGAASYREAYTYRSKVDIVSQYLNYYGNNSNQVEKDAGVKYSNITINYQCWKGSDQTNPVKCSEACVVPSILRFRYSTLFQTDPDENSFYTAFVTSMISDWVTLSTKTEDSALEEILFAKGYAQGISCKEGWNPDWWRALVGVLTSAAGLITFTADDPNNPGQEKPVVEIDWSKLTPQVIQDILEDLIDLFDTNFIDKGEDDCEQIVSAPWNAISPNIDAYTHAFDLIPNKKRMFNLSSTQSVSHRVLRAKVRSKIISDFALMVTIGRDNYIEWPEIEDCCVNKRSVYITGSHEDLWLNGPKKPNDVELGALEDLVIDTYGDLYSWVSNHILTDLFLEDMPDGEYHFNADILDPEFCEYYGFTPSAIFNRDTSESSLISIIHGEDFWKPTAHLGKISIYPNPATDELLISQDGSMISQIKIYDIAGREVLYYVNHDADSSDPIMLNISHLFPGFYFMAIHGSVEKLTGLVIK